MLGGNKSISYSGHDGKQQICNEEFRKSENSKLVWKVYFVDVCNNIFCIVPIHRPIPPSFFFYLTH